MRNIYRVIIAFVQSLLVCASLYAQTPAPTAPDTSITSSSVVGEITTITTDRKGVVVKTLAGNSVTATLETSTTYTRIPPGETARSKFVRITAADFNVGDQVYVRGKMADDRKSITAREFYVMSKTEIVQKRERDRQRWQQRGIVGIITALDPEKKEITLALRPGPNAPRIIVTGTDAVRFLRYAPDSIKYDDAQPSAFAAMNVGDQLRALGDRSADGTRFAAEEIITGSFRTVGGTITALSSDTGEIKLTDLQTKEALTIKVSAESSLRRMPPDVAAGLARSMQAGGGAAPAARTGAPNAAAGTSGGDVNFREIFERLPPQTIAELKPGEMILVLATKGADASHVRAVALVSGVSTLLQGGQASRSLQTLLTGGMGLAATFGQ
jgi:hypothetical protein